jgi:hypothetical protein
MFKKYASTAGIFASVVVVLVFQNCGQTPQSFDGSLALTSTEAPVSLDANCLQSSTYDACLFFKNPTNTLSAVQNSYTFANLDQQQVYGVQLPQLIDSQFLKDPQIQIIDMDGVVIQRANFRLPASTTGDGLTVLLATQSYYWAREVLNYFTTAQADLLAGFKVSIVAQAPVLGWSPSVNTIFLSSDDTELRKNSALDASTLTHLTTEAVIHHLSIGKIYDLTGDTNHKDCGINSGPLLKDDCCLSKNGCSKAISAGLSDFISAMIFPSSPAIGDYFSGDVDGAKSCSLSRNFVKNKLLTFQQAFDSCATSGRSGQFYDMGVVMSATLQAVTSQLSITEKKDFLIVLTKTIQKLKGADNFLNFRDLLLAEAAKVSTASRLTTLIHAEFLKRL